VTETASEGRPFDQEVRQQVEEICGRFQAAWQTGQRPHIEDYLAASPEPGQHFLLRELIKLDLLFRLLHGETPALAEYRARFPEQDLHFTEEFRPAPASTGDGTRGDRTPPLVEPGLPLPNIPGYEILAELGRGGMGTVFKAHQTALKRIVALKTIRRGADAGPDELARFRAEAEAVARLQHPHVVQIYDVGEVAGQSYFTMEYLEGGSLDRKLRGVPQPPAGRHGSSKCWPGPSRPPTGGTSSTATSSRATSSLPPTARPRSATSAWPSASKNRA
jgi:serine/threonine-protein kinase